MHRKSFAIYRGNVMWGAKFINIYEHFHLYFGSTQKSIRQVSQKSTGNVNILSTFLTKPVREKL